MESVAIFSSGAMLSLALWWLEPKDPPATPEEMSKEIKKMLKGTWEGFSTQE